MGLLEDAYRAGLDRGYDMGHAIFSPEGRAEAIAESLIADGLEVDPEGDD
jgi:hypothetical protein